MLPRCKATNPSSLSFCARATAAGGPLVEWLGLNEKAVDANGQALAYVYSRESPNDAQIAGVLKEDS